MVAGELVWSRSEKKWSLMAEYVRELPSDTTEAREHALKMFRGEVDVMHKLFAKDNVEMVSTKRKLSSLPQIDIGSLPRPLKMRKVQDSKCVGESMECDAD